MREKVIYVYFGNVQAIFIKIYNKLVIIIGFRKVGF